MAQPDSTAGDTEKWDELRAKLLQRLDSEFAETAAYTGLSEMPPAVRHAIASVDRHLFVPETEQEYAYKNRPLPIGSNQTISQPFIVAIMTALLEPQPDHVVLEIGTGSGYQAAVLSHLVARIYSVERIKELADCAKERLHRLGYDNVEVRCADGTLGWPEHGPYDGIIVTAGASKMPQALRNQLKAGARLVIPVSSGWLGQNLKVLTKRPDGSFEERSTLPVAFVPLISDSCCGRVIGIPAPRGHPV